MVYGRNAAVGDDDVGEADVSGAFHQSAQTVASHSTANMQAAKMARCQALWVRRLNLLMRF